MECFWNGFEKMSEYTSEQNIKDIGTHGKSWESSGRKLRYGYLGVPAAIAGWNMTKNPLLRAGAAAVGVGGSLVGYAGERKMDYGKGLQTIGKFVRGEKPTEQEWNHLIMNNPSGSLISHVHPELRPRLAKKWSDEYNRFQGKAKQ